MVLGDGTDCDVIALAEDPLEAAVQIFYVRAGRYAASAAGFSKRWKTSPPPT